jgi:hypothetical protein
MLTGMMKPLRQSLVPIALAAAILAAFAGIAAAGWLGKGDRILFSMIQSGLAWCF